MRVSYLVSRVFAFALLFACLWAAPARAQEGGTARDPICDMTVREESALSWTYGGTTYYFCSASCVQQAKAEPEATLGGVHLLERAFRELPGDTCVRITTKPRHPAAGESCQVIFEFTGPAEGSLPEPAEATLGFHDPRGATRGLLPIAVPVRAVREPGTFLVATKPPFAGHVDLRTSVRFRDGREDRLDFRFPVEPALAELSGTELSRVPFTMVTQHLSMRRLGRVWLDARAALFADLADLRRAGEALERVAGYAALLPRFHPHHHADQAEEFGRLAGEFQADLTALRAEVAATEAATAKRDFLRLEAQSCTRCHVKYRWNVLEDLRRFAAR